jgi:hypothetical protein
MTFKPEMIKDLHIGDLVKSAMVKYRVKQVAIAVKFGRKDSTVSRLIRQPDWYVKDLVAASEVIGVNLLKEIPVNIATTGVVTEPGELYIAKSKDLAHCEAELLEKKEIVAVYKKQVRLLEDKMRTLEIELNRLRSAD